MIRDQAFYRFSLLTLDHLTKMEEEFRSCGFQDFPDIFNVIYNTWIRLLTHNSEKVVKDVCWFGCIVKCFPPDGTC